MRWGDSQNGNYVCCGGAEIVCVCAGMEEYVMQLYTVRWL